ncbi:MAG: tetratricopeptide repeat protein [Rhodanobacteraceae bacterium]
MTLSPGERAMDEGDGVQTSPPSAAAHAGKVAERDPPAAAAILHVAARADDAAAQTLLGQLYLDGRWGLPRDHAEALHWFRLAASGGVPTAINMVGRCHENGWGTPVDFSRAAAWYRRAAVVGSAWAIYNYAHMLANGRGVAADQAAAFRWFSRAVAMGHARAMHFLGQYYEHGWIVAADRERAFDLYRRSAELGDYRGRCSHASVLAQSGRVDAAVRLLCLAIVDAPAHYLGPLARELAHSPHAKLRALASQVADALNARSTDDAFARTDQVTCP